MTLSVSGGAAVTYTEGQYNNDGYLDPSLSSSVTPSGTSISLCSGVTSSTCATLISILITGNSPGSYPTGTAGTPTQISYNKTYSSVYSSATGTITLSSVGNVGEKIIGTFDAVVTNMTNSSDSFAISGTFRIKRDF